MPISHNYYADNDISAAFCKNSRQIFSNIYLEYLLNKII